MKDPLREEYVRLTVTAWLAMTASDGAEAHRVPLDRASRLSRISRQASRQLATIRKLQVETRSPSEGQTLSDVVVSSRGRIYTWFVPRRGSVW
jgi:hypothetical protein